MLEKDFQKYDKENRIKVEDVMSFISTIKNTTLQ
jgi:hypothetical protein